MSKFGLFFSLLSRLNLSFLNLEDLEEKEIFKLLNRLTSLEWLSLEGTGIKNISFLKNLKKIEFVNLSSNNIQNYEPLLSLKNLKDAVIDKKDFVTGLLKNMNININLGLKNWYGSCLPLNNELQEYQRIHFNFKKGHKWIFIYHDSDCGLEKKEKSQIYTFKYKTEKK